MATNNLLNQTLRMCEKHPHLQWSGCWAWTGCWGTDRLLGMDQLLGHGLAARHGPAAGAWTGCWGMDRQGFFWEPLACLSSVSTHRLESWPPGAVPLQRGSAPLV